MDCRDMSARSGRLEASPGPRKHPMLEALEPRLLLDGGTGGQWAAELLSISSPQSATDHLPPGVRCQSQQSPQAERTTAGPSVSSTDTSVLTFVQVVRDGVGGVAGLNGAYAVTMSPDGSHVYASGLLDGTLAVFARDETTGELSFAGLVRDGADGVDGLSGVRSVTVSPDGGHVYVAGYWDDALAVFDRNGATGELSFSQVVTDGAGAVDGLNGVYSLAVSSDGRHVYAAGSIDDALAVFSRDGVTGKLAFVEAVGNGAEGMDGVRSIAISPDDRHVYATGFSDDALVAFSRDAMTGALTPIEVVRDDVDGTVGLNGATSVVVSPDGGHVYAAGYYDHAVVVFSRHQATGELTFVEAVQNSGGSIKGLFGACSVTVSPDGNHVFVAGEFDDALAVFTRNVNTGKLTLAETVTDEVDGVDGLNGVRSVTVSPDGNTVYAAGYNDSALAVFSRDAGVGIHLGSISGRKFEDLNGDAVRDAGEPYLNGWVIELADPDSGEVLARQTTTSSDVDDSGTIDPETEIGLYSFNDLPAGSYEVREVIQPGWVRTLPVQTSYSITLGDRQDLTDVDFGNRALPSEIHGGIWSDDDGDGHWDADEPGLKDWRVFIDEDGNGQWDSGEPFQMSGADGSYAFTDLEAGTYVMSEDARDGWVQTFPAVSRPGPQSDFEAAAADKSLAAGREAVLAAAAVTTTGSTAPIYLPGEGIGSNSIDSAVAQAEVFGALIGMGDFRADPRFDGIDGTGFTTVIIDTGIDLDHPFFGPDADSDGVADRIVYSYDFADDDSDASDVHGHGSNVSSIVASGDAMYTGVAPGAGIIHLKVFKDTGHGYSSYVEDALQWVVANTAAFNIASVNMSLGDRRNYSTPQALYGLSDELAALAASDVIVVSASGNDFYVYGGATGVCYPAADANSLSVGAVYASGPDSYNYGGARAYSSGPDRITPFSQRDPMMTTVFAPGAPIIGAGRDGGLTVYHGTSQAAPHIAGVAVLAQQLAVQELGRRLTLAETSVLLRSTAATINDGDDEDDNVTNTGLDFPRVAVPALAEAILAMADRIEGSHIVALRTGQTLTGVDFGNHRKATAAPEALELLPADDTGGRADDNVTGRDNSEADKTLGFAVTGTIPAATVTIYVDGVGVGVGSEVASGATTVVRTNGSRDLADGLHVVTARQTEVGEDESADSAGLVVTIDTEAPTLDAWYSAAVHGTVELLLEIPDDGSFSEPRSGGTNTLVLDFAEPVDLSAASAVVGGNSRDGVMDCSGITAAVANRTDYRGEVIFSEALPDVARYIVRVDGVVDVAGNPLAGDSDRTMTALAGDTNGDFKTNVFDPLHVLGYRGQAPGTGTEQTRSDVDLSADIDVLDLILVWHYRDHDATRLSDPALPLASAASQPVEAMLRTLITPPGEYVPGGISIVSPGALSVATDARSQGSPAPTDTPPATVGITRSVMVELPPQTLPVLSPVTVKQAWPSAPADLAAAGTDLAPSLQTDLTDVLGEQLVAALLRH